MIENIRGSGAVMQRPPRYSICVSNLNSMNTVERWADSLVKNLNDDDEVIIVDGESIDGSLEWLREFCNKRGFRLIVSKTNMGQARQVAYRYSEGAYLIYQLDTDDTVVALREAKQLYHEVIENDPVTSKQRSFRCNGFFIVPRWMLREVGGYPPIQYYEDQLLAYRLASRGWLACSWKVSVVERGQDPKKRSLGFRVRYSFQRIRDGLRLGLFEARNISGYLLLFPSWIAAGFGERYAFRRDWWNMDVHRDEYILPWIESNRLSAKLLLNSP